MKPPDRENLSVAVRSRASRTFLGEVAIVEALTAGAVAGNQRPPSGADGIVLLVGVREAVKRSNKATAVLQAVRARPQEGAVVPEVPAAKQGAAVADLVAVEGPVDGKNWVKMVNIINYKFHGGESDAY